VSWLFGISGIYENSLEKHFVDKNLLFSFQNQNLKIFLGGLKENVFCQKNSESSGWAVCGVGIQKKLSGYSFMDSSDWKEFFSCNESSENLDGHFIVIEWNNKEINFFNDKLGLRELYILKAKDFIAFSTRLDFFSFINHKFEIDYEELGGYWLLSFPILFNCVFKGIVRLGPGGRGTISDGNVEKNNTQLGFDFSGKTKPAEFINELEDVTTFPLNDKRNISLGLSGGLDSRLLLEILMKSDHKNWQTHFFGASNHPDVKIAKQISMDKNIPYLNLNNPVSNPNACLSLLKDCIGQLGPITPASEILVYPYHKDLFNKGWVIIDGAVGEIHRREFFSRILFKSQKGIIRRDIKKLRKILSFAKGSIFNDGVLNLLEKGAMSHISSMFKLMPEQYEVGLENWLDLVYLKFKLPNLIGPSQSLLDSISIAFMPYIQSHLLELSLPLPVEEKKNGKIFRNILDNSANNLNSYRLVKNAIYYPYRTNSFNLRLYLIVKKRLGLFYKDKISEELLNTMKEYVFDTINSHEFNLFDCYNHSKIRQMVNYYYNGNRKFTNQLNWWLTFDIWRDIFFKK
jgi:hypothetical protein